MLASRTLFVFGTVAGLQTLFASAAFPRVRRGDPACNADESLGAVDPHWNNNLNRCVFWDCKPDYVMVDGYGVPFTDDKRADITAGKLTKELLRCTKATKDDCGYDHYKCTDPDLDHLSYCARNRGDKSLDDPVSGALICIQCPKGLAEASSPQNTKRCA